MTAKSANMEIKECTSEFWDEFVERSPQGTVFNKSLFLKSYGHRLRFLVCYDAGAITSAFGFVETHDGIRPMPYLVNAGIIFNEIIGASNYRYTETVHKSLDFWANYLFARYGDVEFDIHWSINDSRPFDWVNFENRENGYFLVIPRFTSLLDLTPPFNSNGYARKRKRDLSKGVNEGIRFSTRQVDDIDLLDRMHEIVFRRQGLERTGVEMGALRAICTNVLDANVGALLATYVNDEPATVSLFVYDRRRAYHLFVGTDEKFRDLGIGTKNLHDSCLFLSKHRGCTELDMVGANSPFRSSFKLSFGSRLVPYFRVKKISPKLEVL